jgi:hypothetical protein
MTNALYKKLIIINIYLLLSISTSICQVQNWLWAKSFNGDKDDYAKSIASDNLGNVYITGFFESDSIILGNIILHNYYHTAKIFVCKLNSYGNVIWARSSATSGATDYGISITTDSDANIYIVGQFFGQYIIFDIDTLRNNDTSGNTADIFISKFDSTGNVIWVKSFGGTNDEGGSGITLDKLGNIYVTGCFKSNIIKYGNISITNLNNGFEIFLVKYNSDGDIIWAKNSIGTDHYVNGITIDSHRNVYIAGGYWSGNITFGNFILAGNTHGGVNSFIAKYDSSGNVIWAKKVDNSYCWSITADNTTNIFITGHFGGWRGTPSVFDNIILTSRDTTGGNIFIAKYDSSGNVIWAIEAGANHSSEKGVNSITLDSLGNVYIVGFFLSDTIFFGNIFLTTSDTLPDWSDIYISKYNTSGDAIWAKKIRRSGWYSKQYLCLINTNSNDFYLTGSFENIILFDTVTFTSDDIDIFIAKLHDLNNSIIEIKNGIDFLVFPNPTNDYFTLTLPSNTISVTISNSLGQIVERRSIENNDKEIFVLHENGIYIIKITTDKETVTKKLIVCN